ncbi:sigma factor G inhibitor Gin [Alteribacillus sp. HJP-4]|uniref:sigma factor G inhibitor Gin n=1 Tax=Alteribacillus sp. HJP-4 TaxID=2775394 RepID=UPI0035CD2E2D
MAINKQTAENWQELCVLCEEEHQEGIHVVDAFICKSCESRLLQLEPGETLYIQAVRKLRKIRAKKLLS